MPTHAGPNTKGQENLVFGYDLGDTRNSFKGAPVENILALGGSDTEIERSGTSYPYYSINIDSYIQSRWSSTNNTLTLSFEGKRDYVAGGTGGGNDGYPVFYIYFTDWSWASTLGVTSYDWAQGKKTFTMPDPSTKSVRFAIYHMNSGNRGRSYSRKHMLSFGSIHKQYINGTRSATQGLIDLKGDSIIDLSNVSFDSNAQMTFDGTSDKLAFPSGLDIPSSGGSIEMVVKRNGTSTNRFLFSKVESGTNRYYMRQPTETTYDAVRGNPLSSTSFGTINTGVYYHLVMVWQNTNLYAYKNGVLESSTTFTNPGSNLNSSGAYIGAFDGGSSGNIAADIALTKFYNRALTASEIKANYNAIKGRFNI